MTPADIEAEACRLFAVWASTQAYPLDFELLGELHRIAWRAVAEASLRAREDVERQRDDLLARAEAVVGSSTAARCRADGSRQRLGNSR